MDELHEESLGFVVAVYSLVNNDAQVERTIKACGIQEGALAHVCFGYNFIVVILF